MNITSLIATEINAQAQQVQAAISLLDEGSTVPFIARYRKEMTGGLDDTQLRSLDEQLRYYRELLVRKETVLKSIADQGKLNDELKAKIASTLNKAELEDLYLPYKPKRRTKAQIAIEAGLLPLAEQLLANPTLSPEETAENFISAADNIADATAALQGAQQILMERFAEEPSVSAYCRQVLWQQGQLQSEVVDDKKEEAAKFRDYFQHEEQLHKAPSHRVLALLRGRKLGLLRVKTTLTQALQNSCEEFIAAQFEVSQRQRAADPWLWQCVQWAWRIKLLPRLEVDCLLTLREQAERVAIDVFAENLSNLLLASPAGPQVTLGLDPGFRTGVKAVVVDETGKLLAYQTIFPHAPQKQWQKSLQILSGLCRQNAVKLISIGNGTASRETDKLAAELIDAEPKLMLKKIMVSEAGASVYSASKAGAEEFPDLDVSYRGAVSIARRLQDPLAELVKIDPKAIGVGQYQHDVNQSQLAKRLDAVVEDCVNQVGVDVNSASASLLTYVSGLNATLAKNIVAYRDEKGAFTDRTLLKKIPRLGEKTYEQAAGFLRINAGTNPLDASAVHPEAYPLVQRILTKSGKKLAQVMANPQFLQSLAANDYIDNQFGLPTVKDIIQELEKPGRDPRPEFKTAEFKEGINKLTDLLPGMSLQGTVTNVTHFGAFVDIGVHQDGLVHKSQMAERYVENPAEVVKVGMIVQVRVTEVDVERKRIALSMRPESVAAEKKSTGKQSPQQKTQAKAKPQAKLQGSLAAALQNALTGKP